MMHDMHDLQCLDAGITPGCYNEAPAAGLLTRGKRIKITAKEKNGLDPSDLSRQKGFLNPNPNWVKMETEGSDSRER